MNSITERDFILFCILASMGEDAFTQYDSKKIQYVIYTLFSSTKPRHVRAFQTRLDDELLLVLKSLPDILIQRFSFCTMSYDTRRIKNEEFSYQITDKSNRYKIEKEEIHICEDISMIKNYPLWVNEYYKYMQNHCLYKLHDFMQQYETIVCLSEVYDSMLMWSHYAQNHRFGLTFILARR